MGWIQTPSVRGGVLFFQRKPHTGLWQCDGFDALRCVAHGTDTATEQETSSVKNNKLDLRLNVDRYDGHGASSQSDEPLGNQATAFRFFQSATVPSGWAGGRAGLRGFVRHPLPL